jgi:3,4-dihydroxy 2-butanone 4-phosphate synthase/GTP cyclohydrolase II
MARRGDLIRFAQFHNLKIGTIADLIAYRRRYDRIVARSLETEFDSRYGGRFRMVVYVNKVAYAEHIALVKGEIAGEEPVLVRMHALNVLDDVLGDRASGKGGELQAAMRMIAEAGRGVVVLIREPLPTSLSDRVRQKLERSKGGSTLRDYGIGAQILSDLGVQKMILLSNTQRTIVGLEGHGLTVVGQRPIAVADGAE